MTRRQAQALAREMRKHRGEWVLVSGAKIVAASPSIKDAINSIPEADRSKVRAQYCPRGDFSDTTYSAI